MKFTLSNMTHSNSFYVEIKRWQLFKEKFYMHGARSIERTTTLHATTDAKPWSTYFLEGLAVVAAGIIVFDVAQGLVIWIFPTLMLSGWPGQIEASMRRTRPSAVEEARSRGSRTRSRGRRSASTRPLALPSSTATYRGEVHGNAKIMSDRKRAVNGTARIAFLHGMPRTPRCRVDPTVSHGAEQSEADAIRAHVGDEVADVERQALELEGPQLGLLWRLR